MLRRLRRPLTHRLSKTGYVLATHQRRRFVATATVLVWVGISIGAFATYAYTTHAQQNSEVERLKQEKKQAVEEVARTQLQMKLDNATRVELEKQVAVLSAQVKQLSEELSFFKSVQQSKN